MMRTEVDPSGAWPLAVHYLRASQVTAVKLASPVLGCKAEGGTSGMAMCPAS